MNQRVSYSVHNSIATVSLNRPKQYNALDAAMFEALIATAKSIRKDKSIRAVILKGEGPGFSSGLDITAIQKSPWVIFKLLRKPGKQLTNLVQEAAYCWRKLPVPVIAVIHGKCFGGGLQIALGADFRIASPDAELSILEAKWGLIPDMTGAVTLPEVLPLDVAKELAMTAKIISGTQAQQLGLVTKTNTEPMKAAWQLAETLSDKSPDALSAIKTLFNDSWKSSPQDALQLETQLQRKVLARWNQIAASSQAFLDNPLSYRKRSL